MPRDRRSKAVRAVRFLCALFLAAAAGCAAYPKTKPLAHYDLTQGYRFEQLPAGVRISKSGRNSDRLFVVLAFSGGGTRAAALSYGVLRQLRDVRFHVNDETGEPVDCAPPDSPRCAAMERTLLDEVDVISSVSGGSFTAAYYALNGGAIFDEAGPFHRKFLHHPVQRDLFAHAVYHPSEWARLRSRPEIAANLYSSLLFGDRTFADLKGKPRPYLILNATDMSTGARFEFTQEQFDLLCADLDRMPIARGVAASSAFPGLLNSMTIDSFNTNPKDGGCAYDGPGSHTPEERPTLTPPQKDWVDRAFQGDRRSDQYYAAEQVVAYKDPRRRHLHLLDGGLADNIGARAILQGVGTFDRPVKRDSQGRQILGGWSALTLMNQRKTKTVLVVIVNAKTGREQDWDTKTAGPGTPSVINVSSGVPMGNFSRETLTRVRDLVREAFPERGAPDAPKIYGLEVAFQDLPEPERALFSNMGTNFDLDPYEVQCLIDRGGSLLRNARFIEPAGATLSSFAHDELASASIGAPAGQPPVCTPAEGKKKIGVRRHYLDVGVQAGAALSGSDDVDGSHFSAGVAFRATRPPWGVVVDIGPQTFPIAGTVSNERLRIGDLRLWSFMGGIARSAIAGRTEATIGISGGYGLGRLNPSLAARDTFGRLDTFGLEGRASNAWLIKPQSSVWYNLNDRWAATVSASYVFAPSTIRFLSNGSSVYTQKVDASVFRVGAGIGFKVF